MYHPDCVEVFAESAIRQAVNALRQVLGAHAEAVSDLTERQRGSLMPRENPAKCTPNAVRRYTWHAVVVKARSCKLPKDLPCKPDEGHRDTRHVDRIKRVWTRLERPVDRAEQFERIVFTDEHTQRVLAGTGKGVSRLDINDRWSGHGCEHAIMSIGRVRIKRPTSAASHSSYRLAELR